MPKGFARPYLLIAVLVIVGAGIAVYSGSKNIAGLVLGEKTRKENIYQYRTSGIKVTVISPDASWDLTEYLCKTKEECQSPTNGKWWAMISGAPTTADGHEVFIEKSADWGAYSYIGFNVRSTNGVVYHLLGSKEVSAISDISLPSASFTFVPAEEN